MLFVYNYYFTFVVIANILGGDRISLIANHDFFSPSIAVKQFYVFLFQVNQQSDSMHIFCLCLYGCDVCTMWWRCDKNGNKWL